MHVYVTCRLTMTCLCSMCSVLLLDQTTERVLWLGADLCSSGSSDSTECYEDYGMCPAVTQDGACLAGGVLLLYAYPYMIKAHSALQLCMSICLTTALSCCTWDAKIADKHDKLSCCAGLDKQLPTNSTCLAACQVHSPLCRLHSLITDLSCHAASTCIPLCTCTIYLHHVILDRM